MIQKNHTNKRRVQYASLKDQFYTKREVIERCILLAKPLLVDVTTCLDCSAGNNVFIELCKIHFPSISTWHAYDIEPMSADVVKHDFLTLAPFPVDVVGFNPPFGYRSCTARKFLAHAALFAPRYMLMILPHSSECIYPPKYKELLNAPLEKTSFYVPTQNKPVCIEHCRFVVLGFDASFVAHKNDTSERLFEHMKRLPQSKVAEWWPAFTRGFAVRRTGVNSGRQLLWWNGVDGGFIDHHGNETEVHAFVNVRGEPISALAFYAYVTELPVTLDFCRKLWSELKSINAELQKCIVPTLPVYELSMCIQKVLDDHK